ncbi:hypothetical protein FRC98_18910 [Lujinxingia vulgaris]|uniref:Uncharacterized protein n=1 Tax=Lujinxingia vulgaris TaxID=2600176 RepID=A0A5C6X5E6_9DELT|nr:hypothetical protein [Lujinxingia vulgaris]TXD34266.1 hypothetical protein FRC98_18910 [Lujinxingia vulgaris]
MTGVSMRGVVRLGSRAMVALLAVGAMSSCAAVGASPESSVWRAGESAAYGAEGAASKQEEAAAEVQRGQYRALWELSCEAADEAFRDHSCIIRDTLELEDGTVIVAGNYRGNVRFAGEVLKGGTMPRAVIARLTGDGELMWVRHFGQGWHNEFHGLAPGDGERFYVSGIGANGFHPEFEHIPDPDHIAASVRGFVGTFTLDGEWAGIRALHRWPSQIAGDEGDLRVYFSSERVVRYSPELEVLEDVAFELEEGASFDVAELVGKDAIWRIHGERREGGVERLATLYHGSEPQFEVVLPGMPSHPRVAVDQEGALTLAGVSHPYEAYSDDYRIHWARVSMDGEVVWSAGDALRFPMEGYRPRVLGVRVAEERVITLVYHGAELEMLGQAFRSSESENAPSGVVRVIHDARTGRLLRIESPESDCLGSMIFTRPDYRGYRGKSALISANRSACHPTPARLFKLSEPGE